MDQAITTLKELPGVFGVCIYDAGNNLVVNQMPPFFPSATLTGLGAMLTDLISLTRQKLSKASDITLHFDEISLIARFLTDKTVLVIGEPHMNERMVSYSLNMLGKPQQVSVTETIQPAPSATAPAAPVEPPAISSASDNSIIEPYITELKNALTKAVGPMADIIFDDALDLWQQAGATDFAAFLTTLQEEVSNEDQFDRFLEAAATEISEIKAREK
ncbi:MAG: hypothetical protein C0622_14795 [Desulfuromonas sp.]|nr:MAG: hypothetical protein C0622_14795 [Desulfuromonas sp.]